MKASDLFVRCLECEGVTHVFAVPGEENLDLLESLRNSTIEIVITRHEQGAGFMAATHGRLTGRAGVCLATLGPGATNLVTAGAYAQLGAMPLLMITGQKPIRSSKQGHFQILDVVDMMRPITKLTHQIVSGGSIPYRVREAFRVAEEERPGAVHLELPEDVAREEADSVPFEPSLVRRPLAEEKAIAKAVELISAARHPLVVVGAGANRKRTANMLRQFVAKTGIPYVSTQMGKGVLEETSDLFLGNAALSADDFVHKAIQASDLIVNVGHDVVEKPPFVMKPGGRTVLHVNFFSAKVDSVYFPQCEVVGDIANSFWQLLGRIEPQSHWDFTVFAAARAALAQHVSEGRDDDRFPLHPRRVVAEVRAAVPDEGLIALDNGIYKIWFAREYSANHPNCVLLDNALATMGAGLPSAMAAAMFRSHAPALAICGDGGFMMNSQELETAVRLGLSLTVIVLRDDAYGMIQWKQEDMGLPNFGLEYGNPDFVKYAESYGARGHRIEAAGDLRGLLADCLARPGVDLIEVPIDYSMNHQILNEEIRQRTQAL